MTDAWGIRANVVDGTSAIATGAACWVLVEKPERALVLARSRSGRWIRVWLRSERIGKRRAGWLPSTLRSRVFGYVTKEEAASEAARFATSRR